MFSQAAFIQVVKVEVNLIDDGYALVRGGDSYYIKGLGRANHPEDLVIQTEIQFELGGIDEADEALAIAEKYGFTFAFGLRVQHERHGFEYNHEEALKKQLQNCSKTAFENKFSYSVQIRQLKFI